MAVKVLTSPIGIDAQRSLGCQAGVDPSFASGTQESRLNGALQSTSNRFGPILPGGDWEITDSLDTSSNWGPSLRGAGGIGRDLGETAYPSGLGSQQVSRLIWKGSDLGTMVKLDAGGAVVENIHFQGCRVSGSGPEPTGGTYPNRARIGLHINTSSGGAAETSKCYLNHLEFQQINTGILVGTDMTGVDEGTPPSSYLGQDGNHADSIYAGDLRFHFPFTGVHSNTGTAIHIRNDQSLANHFDYVDIHGCPHQGVWIERGGKTYIGTLSYVVGSACTGPALRIGKVDKNQGSVTVERICLDAASTSAMALKSDAVYGTGHLAIPSIDIKAMDIPEACAATPMIDVGPGAFYIRNAAYLQASSIKMTGVTTGDYDFPCHVHLENCSIWAGAFIDDLVHASSSGPYLLTWTNCRKYHNGGPPYDYGVVFEDSTSGTEIKSGSMPARITYNGA